jgi:hypothetical protein
MACSLQVFGPDAEYIQIDGNGSNALDFHIAYYIGRLAVQHPDAHFHVISKDTGFDPLMNHLRRQKIRCQRSASVSDVPLVKIANSNTTSEKADVVAHNLAKRSFGKPRTEATCAAPSRRCSATSSLKRTLMPSSANCWAGVSLRSTMAK